MHACNPGHWQVAVILMNIMIDNDMHYMYVSIINYTLAVHVHSRIHDIISRAFGTCRATRWDHIHGISDRSRARRGRIAACACATPH